MARPKPNAFEKKMQQILESISKGSSMRAACRQVDIEESTFRLNCKNNPQYARAYKEAREDGAHSDFDDIKNKRNLMLAGKITPQQFREYMDSIKWELAKKLPKDFGDKQQIDLTSSDGSMSPHATPEQTALKFAEMMDKINAEQSQ